MIGPEPYKLLWSLLSPEKPKDKTFEELAAVLTKHYTPKPSEVVQSFRFFSRVRQPGETVTDFVAELRRLAEDCNFDSTLERMLQDIIVCGINDDAIQKKLLAEEKLTYKCAVELVQGTEAANKHHSEMKTPFKSEPVQTVTQRAAGQTEPTAPKSNACYHCGVTGHKASECRFKDKTCHNCKKKGHIAKACRSKPKPTRTANHRSKKVHQVSEELDSESDREGIWGVDSVEDHGERIPPISVCATLK